MTFRLFHRKKINCLLLKFAKKIINIYKTLLFSIVSAGTEKKTHTHLIQGDAKKVDNKLNIVDLIEERPNTHTHMKMLFLVEGVTFIGCHNLACEKDKKK